MIQVLPAAKTFGGEFAKALGGGAGKGFSESNDTQQRLKQEKLQEERENTKLQLQHQMNKELQQQKYEFESEKAGRKLREEKEANIAPLQGAMDTLNRMKALRKKGNLGIGSTYSLFGETRKEAGEYEQLGKSLIQYATNIPIRNRIEFETLAENLYDPTTTDAKAEGILNAMERIITNSLQSSGFEGSTSQNKTSNGSTGNNQRPPLSSFKIGAR